MSQQQFTSAFARGQGNPAPVNNGTPQNMTFANGQGMNAPFDMGANDNAGLPYGQNNQALDNVGMPHNGNWAYQPNLTAPANFQAVNNQAFDFGQGNAAPGPIGMPQNFGPAFGQSLRDPASFKPGPDLIWENGQGLAALSEDEMGMMLAEAPFDTVNAADLRKTGNAPPPALPPTAPTPAAQQPEMAQQGHRQPAAALTPPPALPAAAAAFPAPQPAQPTPGYYPAQDNMAAQQPGNYTGVSDTIPMDGAAVFGPPAPNDMVPAAASQAQGQVGARFAPVTPERRAEIARQLQAERGAKKLGPRRPKTTPAPSPPRVEKKKAHSGPEKSRDGWTQRKAWNRHDSDCLPQQSCVETCPLLTVWNDVWQKNNVDIKVRSIRPEDEGEMVWVNGLWKAMVCNRDQYGTKGRPSRSRK